MHQRSSFPRPSAWVNWLGCLATLAIQGISASLADVPTAVVTRQVVAEGLAHPWDIAFLSDQAALVTEKDGTIMHVDLRSGQLSVVRGVPGDLDNERLDDPRDNSGLFGIALDPDFAREPWVYVAYSAGDETGTRLKVVRARWQGEAAYGLSSMETLLVVEPPSTDRFHYGGGIAFGGDGKLYVTAGERVFDEIDQPALPLAQDVTDMRGKIYRLHKDGAIPTDNPPLGDGAAAGVYALGIRAAQGLTRHPTSGALWFTEHGSVQGDEVNILRPGANYGWPV
ncbi:MAG: PQQ-dependent sugar dehydrogenase, partial [Pseudomonadota bacterium]